MKIFVLKLRLKFNQSKLFVLRLFRRFCEKCEEPEAEEKKPDKKYELKHKFLHSFDPATWTLKSMLEDIETTFNSLSFKDHGEWSIFHLVKQERTMLRHIGPRLLSRDSEFRTNRLEFHNIFKMPAVSFVCFGRNGKERNINDKNRIPAVFAYAIKHDKHYPHVELTRGSLYRCGTAYLIDGRLRWLAFFVGISQNGEIKALKSEVISYETIRNKKDGPRHVPTKSWKIEGPEEWIGWLDAKDISDALCKLAAITINSAMTAEWHWQVVVSKGKNKITVPVPQNEAKRFFKERDIEENGKRNPIYHLVASHYRKLKSGKIVPVRPHSRGKRKFSWKGYEINIIEPGKHMNFLSAFDAEAYASDEDAEMPKGMIPLAAGGKRIGQAMQND